jgi:hypothetical protein
MITSPASGGSLRPRVFITTGEPGAKAHSDHTMTLAGLPPADAAHQLR